MKKPARFDGEQLDKMLEVMCERWGLDQRTYAPLNAQRPSIPESKVDVKTLLVIIHKLRGKA
jgi:hypothetical protein